MSVNDVPSVNKPPTWDLPMRKPTGVKYDQDWYNGLPREGYKYKTTAHPELDVSAKLAEVQRIVIEWLDAPAWPGPDHLEFMNRIARVFE